ncbi:MAG: pyruvate kinase [Clostridiaceae bacterium]
MDIIFTVSPKTMGKTTLTKMAGCGGNVIRLNFSHFDENFFINSIKEIRENNLDISILGDIQGNKIRVAAELRNPIKLSPKEVVKVCSYEEYQNLIDPKGKIIPINQNSEEFSKIKSKEIFFQDGEISLTIMKKTKDYLEGRVKRGGIIRAEKSCNIKGYIREEGKVTKKDKKDIEFCLKEGFNIIALSYIESRNGFLAYKNCILERAKEMGARIPEIYAKIETLKGVINLNDISKEAQGIIIARGDLVPEAGISNLPIIQRIIFSRCKEKKIIIATHLLDSLVKGGAISTSEVNDIYWFIKNGVSGFLLAKETSASEEPNKAIIILKRLIEKYC